MRWFKEDGFLFFLKYGIFLKEEIFFIIACNDACIFVSITQFLHVYTHGCFLFLYLELGDIYIYIYINSNMYDFDFRAYLGFRMNSMNSSLSKELCFFNIIPLSNVLTP